MPYEAEIYQMLYDCFYETSLAVITNKHPASDLKRLVRVVSVGDERTLDLPNENLSNDQILERCISSGSYVYNLRTECLEDRGCWSVVNSTATDIEILRAVVNVLTTVITSSQYLSVTQRYDRKMNDEKTLKKHLDEDYRIIQNKTNAFMDTLATNENYDLLQGLIGGIHVDAEDFETSNEETDEKKTPVGYPKNLNVEQMITPRPMNLSSEDDDRK